MKRLRYYLLNMKGDNETYKEMYAGKMREPVPDGFIEHNQPVYWDEQISYTITKSNRIELSRPTVTVSIPVHMLGIKEYSDVAADFAFRRFIPYIDELNEAVYNRKRTDKENGRYYLYRPNNKVQKRNVSYFSQVTQKYYEYLGNTTIRTLDHVKEIKEYTCLNLVLQIQLPHKKHKKGITMLTKDLPDAVRRYVADFETEPLEKAIALSDLQKGIRKWLRQSEYCAFIANGSILPRENDGESPLADAVPFVSTKEDEVMVCGICGMGIRKGVSVITGGGYSGKSTLLDALSNGIYNHIGGDGRELVITDDTAMKISAEDGRSIRNENLMPFIQWIPGGHPENFSTDHASGSTSQAANVMEAVDYGCQLLLLDEDKSATNFMIRDAVMKRVIEREPIVPFVDRVAELYQRTGISTIAVIGGCSDFFSVADQIYILNDYKISHITREAKEMKGQYGMEVEPQIPASVWKNRRRLRTDSLTTYPDGNTTEYLAISDMGFICIADEKIDVRMLHNIASMEQLNSIVFLIRKLANQINTKIFSGKGRGEVSEYVDVKECIQMLLHELEQEGLESLHSAFFTECGRWMEMPRLYEVMAVINRMRMLMFEN